MSHEPYEAPKADLSLEVTEIAKESIEQNNPFFYPLFFALVVSLVLNLITGRGIGGFVGTALFAFTGSMIVSVLPSKRNKQSLTKTAFWITLVLVMLHIINVVT